MNRLRDGHCEWPVQDWLGGTRTCSRESRALPQGMFLCWQHRRNLAGEIVNSQLVDPDREVLDFLSELGTKCAPDEYDCEEVAKNRAQLRVVFVRALAEAIRWGAVHDDQAPFGINHVLDKLVEERFGQRFDEMWGVTL